MIFLLGVIFIISIVLYKQFLLRSNKILGVSSSCPTNQPECLFLSPYPIFDSSTYIQYNAAVNGVNWNHTTTAQANRVLIVTVSYGNNQQSSNQVTYGGTNLKKLSSQMCSAISGSTCNDEMWYLINPSTGTFPVALSINGGPAEIVAAASTYYNVDQTNPVGSILDSSGKSSTAFVTVSGTTPYQLIVDAFAAGGIGGPYLPDSSQTQIYEANTYNAGGGSFKFANANNTTMLWSINSSQGGDNWALIAVSLNVPSAELPLAITYAPTPTNSNNVVQQPVNLQTSPSTLTQSPTSGQIRTQSQIPTLIQVPILLNQTSPLNQVQTQTSQGNGIVNPTQTVSNQGTSLQTSDVSISPISVPGAHNSISQTVSPTTAINFLSQSNPTTSLLPTQSQNQNSSAKSNLLYHEAAYVPFGIDLNFAQPNHQHSPSITVSSVVVVINNSIKSIFLNIFNNIRKIINR